MSATNIATFKLTRYSATVATIMNQRSWAQPNRLFNFQRAVVISLSWGASLHEGPSRFRSLSVAKRSVWLRILRIRNRYLGSDSVVGLASPRAGRQRALLGVWFAGLFEKLSCVRPSCR